ncbi:MMPL family transporter [Streptomyces yaizuensis]|uniref:MMPL family transporter n=1 Tax=Streptomyces yaizuensis TaxID=2989713 RepID=A0ABQ5NR26_9ACTN|nr:MMPL family transporter [Streptomyces sp. YSPA8]
MTALARWCYRHRLVVLVLWVGVLFGVGAVGTSAGSDYSNDFALPGTDSTRANELLEKARPGGAGDTGTVVWQVADGSVRDAGVRSRIEPALREIAGMDGIGEVGGPYGDEPGAAARISEDGRTAYAEVAFAKRANSVPTELAEAVVDTARAAAGDGLRVEVGGQAIARIQQATGGTSELVGIAAAAVVLFLAFGSFFAMLLPIVVAVFGVGIGLFSTMLLSHGTGIPDLAPLLGSLVGLGVGIDYALFIVTRHRRALLHGESPPASVGVALNTAGRAVVFAGATVCIALAGMLVMNLRFLDGVVIATTLTVVLSVLAAVTLLPALLGFLGPRVLSRRQRRRLAEQGPERGAAGGLAVRWSGQVQRRPRSLVALALVALTVLALPVLSLRLGATDQGNHPEGQTTRQAYDLLAEGFGPGFNGPLVVVAEGADPDAVRRLTARVTGDEGVAQVAALPPAGGVSVVRIVPTTSPQSEDTDRLIDRLRDDHLPRARVDGHVGGVTAVFKDFAEKTGERLPYFVASIVGLGFVLLLIAFRSLLVPLTAAVMNLVAAAASFGVVVAVFQWGWGLELIGLDRSGPISAFLPVIMLSLLFGLSMDYQVFLVSRMHEEWMRTRDNARAVRVGLAETSRVINSAALIMICVFLAFVLSGDMEAVVAGAGLAVAVAVDAFILRTALVPALMHLLGRSNWWLPGWLDRRLPHLAVEGSEAPPGTGRPGTASKPGAAGPATGGSAVHGFVRTVEGGPVAGAVVTLRSVDGGTLDRVRSLADGSYVLAAPAPGAYLLAVAEEGGAEHTRRVTTGDSPLVQDMELAEDGVEVR